MKTKTCYCWQSISSRSGSNMRWIILIYMPTVYGKVWDDFLARPPINRQAWYHSRSAPHSNVIPSRGTSAATVATCKRKPLRPPQRVISVRTECKVQRLLRKGKMKETIYIRNLESHRLTDVRLKFIRRTHSEFKLAVTMSINIRPLLLA